MFINSAARSRSKKDGSYTYGRYCKPIQYIDMSKNIFGEAYDDPDDDPLRFDSVYGQSADPQSPSDSPSSSEETVNEEPSDADAQQTTICIDEDASPSELQ